MEVVDGLSKGACAARGGLVDNVERVESGAMVVATPTETAVRRVRPPYHGPGPRLGDAPVQARDCWRPHKARTATGRCPRGTHSRVAIHNAHKAQARSMSWRDVVPSVYKDSVDGATNKGEAQFSARWYQESRYTHGWQWWMTWIVSG
eukprot:6481351-Amphidinium_carterae.1